MRPRYDCEASTDLGGSPTNEVARSAAASGVRARSQDEWRHAHTDVGVSELTWRLFVVDGDG